MTKYLSVFHLVQLNSGSFFLLIGFVRAGVNTVITFLSIKTTTPRPFSGGGLGPVPNELRSSSFLVGTCSSETASVTTARE